MIFPDIPHIPGKEMSAFKKNIYSFVSLQNCDIL